MQLKEFFQKNPNAKFVRFFYDIVYDYAKIQHCCLYVKYQDDNKDLSKQIFDCVMITKESLTLDKKYIVKGYDSTIFDKNNLINQFDNLNKVCVIIDEINKNYFIDYVYTINKLS